MTQLEEMQSRIKEIINERFLAEPFSASQKELLQEQIKQVVAEHLGPMLKAPEVSIESYDLDTGVINLDIKFPEWWSPALTQRHSPDVHNI